MNAELQRFRLDPQGNVLPATVGDVAHYARSVAKRVLGDKEVTTELPTSRDSAATRTAALAVLAACCAVVYWVSSLGG